MTCPYCKTENVPGAVKCAACASWISLPPPAREWTRTRKDRLVAGVCRGLANRFGFPVAAVRLAFILSVLFGFGFGALLYIAFWIAMPLPPEPWLDQPATLATGTGAAPLVTAPPPSTPPAPPAGPAGAA